MLIFKGLANTTNEVVEVRFKFHVTTDIHEQMASTIQACENSCNTLGRSLPENISTDNPKREKGFFA